MPELLGFEGDKAKIGFPNARKHIPGQGAVPHPHEKLMSKEDIQNQILAIENAGKDPSFFRAVEERFNQTPPRTPQTRPPSGPGGMG